MLTAWPKLRKFQRLGAQPPFPPHLTQNPKPSRNFDANSSTSNARMTGTPYHIADLGDLTSLIGALCLHNKKIPPRKHC
jgi:hypothetical protein